MAEVRIEALHKEFRGKPPTVAARNMNLTIGDGEFLVLLGPSGCGKTTTLRCLAGLESPDRGKITIGRGVALDAASGTDLPPEKRDIGMVFQSYALWPHLTVRQNIEYPLKARRLREGLQDGWALEMAKLVEVESLMDRYPGQLSGGQQQRVALARGLVARPGLVLFDEPLSNLDARLRDQVRSQLHQLHSRLRFTAVFVTHDQSEALSLADRIAVMNKGSIEQLDTARRVFEEPATEYVAGFMGMTERLPMTLRDGAWMLAGESALKGIPPALKAGAEMVARVRPQDLYIEPDGTQPPEGSVCFTATVEDVAFAGRFSDIVVSAGGRRMQGRTMPGTGTGGIAPGQKVCARFAADRAAFYATDGQRLAGNLLTGGSLHGH
ncbi:ABC transporter ATP-binding protein [Aquibium microcysteis]|uniref:ABC transporter ATP-binding protein n=1 Tax=Aquibium microcysteis TaxID=675281 RepID=UPI001AEE3F0C|nr:ABC transporter ATP-binding protein [Aquibium microcysteis]